MPFPDTVSPVSKVAEIGYYGPFFYLDGIYVVNTITDPDTEETFLAIFRSTDGINFTEQDDGNRPLMGDTPYACCQSTADLSQIYCVYVDPDTGDTAIRLFDAATNTWGAVIGTTNNGAGFALAAYRPNDNSIVIVGFDNVTTFLLVHVIPAFYTFDLDSSTFSAVTPMSYEDYDDATLWDLQPRALTVDSDGRVHVFSQQIPQRSNPNPQAQIYTEDGNFNVPGDCIEIENIQVFAAGGGGGGGTLEGNGGGGGGGFIALASLSVTPGDVLPVVVGTGGAQNAPGGDSSFGGVTANGGQPGSVPDGGAGGTGDFAGGAGGDGTAGLTGGGGGGSAGSGSVGEDGANGGVNEGGLGGAPGTGGSRGEGGQGGTINGVFGIIDGAPGVNGGGGGGGVNNGIGGDGGDGLVTFEYTPFTNEHPGRVYHQSILTDNALGTLQEITRATFPFGNGPIAFDSKSGSGFVVIAFSGVTETEQGSILAGRSNNGDELTFTFQTVSVGNASSGIDPSPALVVNGISTHLLYMRATTLLDVEWFYRTSVSGGAFSAAVSIGEFDNPGCRIQGGFGIALLCLTFWRPTYATVQFVGGEGIGTLTLTSLLPGLAGNLIRFSLTPIEDGEEIDITFTESIVGQYLIEVTYGYTDEGIIAGTWAAMAALINANAQVSEILEASGTAQGGLLSGLQTLTGGTSGQGELP